jgi:DNA repair protein RadC
MELLQYQRPREKLRSKGVRSLSMVELFQIVLGPGSPKASGATIARKVEGVCRNGTASYDDLVAVQGVGEAKACQILAMLEFSNRLNTHE